MFNGIIIDGVRYTPDTLFVNFTATFECVHWDDDDNGDPEPDPTVWGGFCDPTNPWGTADDDLPTYEDWAKPFIGEPIVLTLPMDEAVDFALDFTGAVWDLVHDCESSPNWRTGVDTTVTLHFCRDAVSQAALARAAARR